MLLGFVNHAKATRVSENCVSSNDLFLSLNSVLLKRIVSNIKKLIMFCRHDYSSKYVVADFIIGAATSIHFVFFCSCCYNVFITQETH